MKIEIDIPDADAACVWANYNEHHLGDTIAHILRNEASRYRQLFPSTIPKVTKSFAETASLMEPETVKALRLALDRIEQLATTEQDGLLIERIQDAMKGYPSPKTPIA